MLPYWILFAIFAAGALEYRRRQQIGRDRQPLLWIAAVVTTLMIGLRFQVGADWDTYVTIFEGIRYQEWPTLTSDPAYALLNWLSVQLGLEIWFVNLVCAIIFMWGVYRFARQQPNPWLAVLVAVPYLIIVVAMGYTRQAVAIGLILAGLSGRDHIPLVRFALFSIVAATFHKSAVVVVPLVALAATRNRILTALLMAVLALFLYYFFVSGYIDSLVTNYVGAEYSSQGAGVRIAMNVPPALLFL